MSKLSFVVNYNELYESLTMKIDGKEYHDELLVSNKQLFLEVKIRSKVYDNTPITILQSLLLIITQKEEWFLPYTFNYRCNISLSNERNIQIPIKINLRKRNISFNKDQINNDDYFVTNAFSYMSISNNNLQKYRKILCSYLILLFLLLTVLCIVFIVLGGGFTILIPISVLMPIYIIIICRLKRQYDNCKKMLRE